MDFEKVNNIITKKTREAKDALIAEQSKLNMQHGKNRTETDTLDKLKTNTKKNAGVINRIRFKFKKSGVFVHKGVGNGTPISKVGSTKRKAKPWFNPVIERFAEKLSDEVMDELLEVNYDKLKIK
jgi:hypothetical protein